MDFFLAAIEFVVLYLLDPVIGAVVAFFQGLIPTGGGGIV